MTDGFANAITVSMPILALAAGAEARTIRDRLKRPDQRWERELAKYNAAHELDEHGSAAEVFAYFKAFPAFPGCTWRSEPLPWQARSRHEGKPPRQSGAVAGQRAEARGFEPRMGANPNRANRLAGALIPADLSCRSAP
jgi:hypothetical protein